ncbi:hypothetical protein [Hymenobacter sp. PAMC 26628]|uniref:hypothetical protein n=1 Tax=Hymenobacter sp. PAMC 26628 TaxID=1484118 RepID=UPI000770364A|nr:hypothetical protein [Hymenobacter sp. PAMC 26628]AMJ66470.1 hypothetical protein AXW84_14300 [Hymenobacter sp. PAMC 26628]
MTPFRSLPACLPAALLLIACGRQPQAASPSRFAAAPPTIDGQTTDWGPDSLHYDAESKLQYAVLNDQRAVYVRLKVSDPMTQGRLLSQGFTVWLDSTGQNQQQFGVRYTLHPEPVAKPALDANGQPVAAAPMTLKDRRARLAQALADVHDMELLNYKGNKEPTYTDTQSPLGVKLGLALDAQDNIVYELAVPMRLLYRKVPSLASGQRAKVGVTVLSNRMAMPKGSGADDNGYGVGGSNSGMGGGMGGRGGMGGYGGRGMRGGYMGPQPLTLKVSAQLSGQ